jgi:hypothetical protein
MRYEDRPMNGHHQPNWDLFGILLGLQGSVSRVESALERTHEQVTAGLDRANERIDTVHERIDAHLATPKPERRGWLQSLGLSPKELAGLLLLVGMGLFGTLTPEHVTAWLSR